MQQRLQQRPGIGLLVNTPEVGFCSFEFGLPLRHFGLGIDGAQAQTKLLVVSLGGEQAVFFGIQQLAALVEVCPVWAGGSDGVLVALVFKRFDGLIVLGQLVLEFLQLVGKGFSLAMVVLQQ